MTYLKLGSVVVDVLEQWVKVFRHSIHVVLIKVLEVIAQRNQHVVSGLKQRCFLLVLIDNQLGLSVDVVLIHGHDWIAPQCARIYEFELTANLSNK